MSQSPAAASTPGYLMPEDAHHTLRRTRDQLCLLACLAQPRSYREQDEDTPIISLHLWYESLQHLCEQLDHCLEAADWQP